MRLALGRGGADTQAAPPSTSYDNCRQKSLEQDRQPVDPASRFRCEYLGLCTLSCGFGTLCM